MSFAGPRNKSARDGALSPPTEPGKSRAQDLPQAIAAGSAGVAFADGPASDAEDDGVRGQTGDPLIVRVRPAIAHADGHFDASGRQARQRIRRALGFDGKTFI